MRLRKNTNHVTRHALESQAEFVVLVYWSSNKQSYFKFFLFIYFLFPNGETQKMAQNKRGN